MIWAEQHWLKLPVSFRLLMKISRLVLVKCLPPKNENYSLSAENLISPENEIQSYKNYGLLNILPHLFIKLLRVNI